MTLDDFVIRALSVPYVPNGREWSGWDCWGLVYVAYQELFGITISRLDNEYKDDVSFAELDGIVNIQKQHWFEPDRPEYGDVKLFNVSRYQSHVALVLPKGQMIHSTKSTGTLYERSDTSIWAKRHAEYYRHEKRRLGSGGAPPAQD